MSRPTRCDYFRGITDLNALTRACELFARDIHDRLLVGRLEGDNLSDSLLKADGGLSWSRLPNEPKRLMASLLSTKTAPAIRKKEGAGLELIVNANDPTSGRVCVVDKDTLGTQIISFIPDDPEDGTSGGAVDFPAGIGVLRTSGNFNLRLSRNSILMLELTSTHIEASDDLLPSADSTLDLGASATAWKEIYGRTIDSGSNNTLAFQQNNVTKLDLQSSTINAYTSAGVQRFLVNGTRKTLTDGVATQICTIGMGSAGASLGITIFWTVTATDGTNYTSRSGIYVMTGVQNVAADERQVSAYSVVDSGAIETGGPVTLSVAFSHDTVNPITVLVNANSSYGSPTIDIYYSIISNSTGAVTIS